MKRIWRVWKKYESLSSELEKQKIDPNEYPRLLTEQKRIQKELNLISKYQSSYKGLEDEKGQVFHQIEENRRTLSENRQQFLTTVLQGNPSVSITVKPFCENWDGGEKWDGVEKHLRKTLKCPVHFDRDIDALREIYEKNDDEKIEKLKERIKRIYSGVEDAKDARFAAHLIELPQESVIDLHLWFPRDALEITFGPNNRRIEQASPGQKSAALLAFILSYGIEPLLLDQPEDDLDNELIYKLVVEQLRKTKSKRQVIVVTHNANIVVNGDAEMVLPLEVGGGETHVRQAASIQEKEVREAICDILEGGQQAFEQRYKRIHLRN